MNYLKYLQAAGVPEQLHAEALESLSRSKELAAVVAPYKLKAPFVMAWVVQWLDWDAEKLPLQWYRYDNEVSINGDGWGKQVDGKWVTVREPGDPDCIPYTDPKFGGDAYYANAHPRSKWARWVWLGLRNRASMFAYSLGPPASKDIQVWGDPKTDKDHPGVVVYRMNGNWQIYTCTKLGPFVIRRNVGFKISNVARYAASRAAAVHIPFSILRSK